jgi:CDP-diacylglycerol--serine O-phosphatidyltransferase
MVSRVRYRSFKDIDLRNRRSFVYTLPLAAALVAVAYKPTLAAVTLAGAYVVSGPLGWLVSFVRRAGGPPTADSSDALKHVEVADEPAGR